MAKTIHTILYDDVLDGSKIVTMDNCVCQLFDIKRDFDTLIRDEKDVLSKPALYILLNRENRKAYIGETDDFLQRIASHNAKKGFWDEALAFMANDSSLTTTEVRYLESLSYEIARNANSYDLSENTQVPKKPFVQKIQEWFSFKTEFVQLADLKDVDMTSYFIVIAAWIFSKDDLQNMLEEIRYCDTRFYHISEWYFLEDVVYKPENISNLVAMEYKHSKLDWRSIVLKRICDIIISFFAIIILFPFMVIIWILIKLDSKWPVFFTQKRVWLHGKEFTFIKFRSMVQDAEDLKKNLLKQNERSGPLFKIKDDPRVTKFWKFLRKSSIDELPQLFCVFIGTMSLIWPRPHLPDEVKNYENWQKRLLSIKPWISGYAQVFGRDNLSFSEEARLDLYYIQNRSIFLDFYVILATFKVVFKGK